MKYVMALLLLIVATGSALARSCSINKNVVYVSSYQNFQAKFCTANPNKEKVFILPASIFKYYKVVKCRSGTFTLRVTEPPEDIGHDVFNIDPPRGVVNAFDCDGKADIGMKTIGINCYPVRRESVSHPRT